MSLTLTFSPAAPSEIPAGSHGLRVTVASSTPSVPHKLLVMQLGYPSPRFVGISTPAQVHDLPEGAAVAGSPFYRVDSATIISRSAAESLELKARIDLDVREFYEDWTALSELSSTDVVTIP